MHGSMVLAVQAAHLTIPTVPPAQPAPAGTGPEWGSAGPFGLLVIVLLGIAVYFLAKSMSRNLKKVPRSFDDDDRPPTPGAHAPGAELGQFDGDRRGAEPTEFDGDRQGAEPTEFDGDRQGAEPGGTGDTANRLERAIQASQAARRDDSGHDRGQSSGSNGG